MGNKRFSATTWVLVGLSLVALYFVGTKVTPPPAPPPKEAPPAPVVAQTPAQALLKDANPPALQKREDTSATQARMAKIQAASKKTPVVAAPKTKFNPTAMDTDSNYWKENRDGQKGIENMHARVTQAEEELAKEHQQLPSQPVPIAPIKTVPIDPPRK